MRNRNKQLQYGTQYWGRKHTELRETTFNLIALEGYKMEVSRELTLAEM